MYKGPPAINPELVIGPDAPDYCGYDALHIPASPGGVLQRSKYPWKRGPTLLDWEGNEGPPIELPVSEANPKTLMGRLKVRNLSVVPMTALIEEARAMTYGAFESPRKDGTKGYGPFNWRDNDIEYMAYVEAAFRHIMSAADREDIDPETGEHKISHLALARATLGILIDALAHGMVIDNRPTNARGVVASLLREYRKKE